MVAREAQKAEHICGEMKLQHIYLVELVKGRHGQPARTGDKWASLGLRGHMQKGMGTTGLAKSRHVQASTYSRGCPRLKVRHDAPSAEKLDVCVSALHTHSYPFAYVYVSVLV